VGADNASVLTRTAALEKSCDPAANCAGSGGSDRRSGTATSGEPSARSPRRFSDPR